MTKVVLFDTETTGLIKNTGLALNLQPRVIEFYGMLVDDQSWEIEDEVEFLADPGFQLEEIITRITGLTDADLGGEKPFRENAQKVHDLMESGEEVVAHNLSYDLNMVDFEFRRIGDQPCPWPAIRTCTVLQTEWIKGHRMSLTNLHHHLFGEPFDGAHRAREDVAALLRCFKKLREDGNI